MQSPKHNPKLLLEISPAGNIRVEQQPNGDITMTLCRKQTLDPNTTPAPPQHAQNLAAAITAAQPLVQAHIDQLADDTQAPLYNGGTLIVPSFHRAWQGTGDVSYADMALDYIDAAIAGATITVPTDGPGPLSATNGYSRPSTGLGATQASYQATLGGTHLRWIRMVSGSVRFIYDLLSDPATSQTRYDRARAQALWLTVNVVERYHVTSGFLYDHWNENMDNAVTENATDSVNGFYFDRMLIQIESLIAIEAIYAITGDTLPPWMVSQGGNRPTCDYLSAFKYWIGDYAPGELAPNGLAKVSSAYDNNGGIKWSLGTFPNDVFHDHSAASMLATAFHTGFMESDPQMKAKAASLMPLLLGSIAHFFTTDQSGCHFVGRLVDGSDQVAAAASFISSGWPILATGDPSFKAQLKQFVAVIQAGAGDACWNASTQRHSESISVALLCAWVNLAEQKTSSQVIANW